MRASSDPNSHSIASGNARFLVALFLFCTSCTVSTRISQDPIDQAIDWASLSTYRWDRSSLAAMAPAEGVSLTFSSIIRAEIDAALAAGGYREVAGGPADMTLDFRVTIKDSVASYTSQSTGEVTDVSFYGLRWRFGEGRRPVALERASPAEEISYYDEGTLHVGVFDADNRMIWHVFASKVIEKEHTPSEHRNVLRKTVRRIMGRFPSRASI